MKLFNKKEESAYLSKDQWRKVFMAMSIITIALYIVAMVFSLSGSHYFILNYQNEQMDRIENWFRGIGIYSFLSWLFSTIEFVIILSFITRKMPKWYYVLAFYLPVAILACFLYISNTIFLLYPLLFYFSIPLIEQIKDNKINSKKFNWKIYGKHLLRLLIAVVVVFTLQLMIYVIKAGYFSVENHILPLSGFFIYSLEYDIALLVILVTLSLYINRGKGDSKQWAKLQDHGSSSLTTKTNSQKLSSQVKMSLTKTQRTRLTKFWIQFYLVQILGFLLLMVLPFIMGKVLEFLTMYLSFAVARYILGFKYSLHYKKESVCISVGAIVFGILTLAVPFFYVIIVVAILFGVGLAVLLHLSYKYKGMWLFTQVSKPDKFALLYVFFDGDLEDRKIRNKCRFKGLNLFQVNLISDFMKGDKISYLAHKNNYSQRMLIYKLDESMSGFGGGIGLLVLILIFLFGFGGNGSWGGGYNSATEVYSKLASETASVNSRDIISQGYENQLATQKASYDSLLQFKDVQAQLASCCCDIKSTVIEQNQLTRDLINANTITELRAELVEARDEIVTGAQTQALLNVLAPRPVPTTAIYGYPVF